MHRAWLKAMATLVVGISGLAVESSVAAAPRGELVLAGDAIGDVKIGTPQPEAMSALRSLLGDQGELAKEPGLQNCGIDGAANWPDVDAFFFRDRFVGYGFSVPSGEHGINAVATGGLRQGMKISELRRLYGRSLRLSGEQGGAYFVTTQRGTIDGTFSDEINQPDARVLGIDAGNVGCPAVSP